VRSIQNEYIRNADITSIWDDIRIAYMNELGDMAVKIDYGGACIVC